MKTCCVVVRESLPHGLIMELPRGGPAVLAYDGVDHPPVFCLRPGANDEVPYDMMAGWLKANANLPAVRNRQVFIVGDGDVVATALSDTRSLRAL